MGYGVHPPGYWSGKKNLTWRLQEGSEHPELDRAFGIWQQKVGITFTRTASADVTVDFVVKNSGSVSQWSPSLKTMFLKGKETLGATLHEIGHLLGMSHEHDRPDRRGAWYKDNPGTLGEAESVRQAELRAPNLRTYGDYDADSIMQYPQSKYIQMTQPSSDDVAAVKTINGWQ